MTKYLNFHAKASRFLKILYLNFRAKNNNLKSLGMRRNFCKKKSIKLMEVLLTYNVNKLSRFLWYLDLCEIPPLNLLNLKYVWIFPPNTTFFKKYKMQYWPFWREKNQEHFWLWIFKRKLTFRKTYKINSWSFFGAKIQKKSFVKKHFFRFFGSIFKRY